MGPGGRSVAGGRIPHTDPGPRGNHDPLDRTQESLRDRILHVLSSAPIPMDVENVRIKSGLKNWESTKALLLELVVEGLISGQKTTKSWVFWIDHTDTRMSIAGRNHA